MAERDDDVDGAGTLGGVVPRSPCRASGAPFRRRDTAVVADPGPGSSFRYRSGSGWTLTERATATAAPVVTGVLGVSVCRPDGIAASAVPAASSVHPGGVHRCVPR